MLTSYTFSEEETFPIFENLLKTLFDNIDTAMVMFVWKNGDFDNFIPFVRESPHVE